MPLDASIYGQVGRGVRSVADYDAEALGLENARTQGEANRLALMLKRQEADQMAASAADQNALRQLYVELGNTPLDQMGTELRKRGRFNEGLKADQDAAKLANERLTGQKTQADIGKIGAETTGRNVETVGKVTAQFREQLTSVRNPDDAVRWLKAQYDHPILGPEMERMAGPFMEAASRIPTTPQEFAQYIQSTGMGMEKFIQNQTAIRGQDTVASTAAANRERMAADAAANRAIQIRGQDKVDARAREANARKVADDGKPLPSAALKMQQEALDAIGVAGAITSDLGAIEKQIESGKLKFGPVSNIINRGRNLAGVSNEESRNLSSFKSSLERLRNESLRLNTGVQTDGDAQRAWNELFENINDTDLVKQRLQEIQRINKRGVELQRLKVDSVRANYGKPPIETESYSAQPAAVGATAVKPGTDLGGGFRVK